jgi:hypothetical protein
MRHFYSVWITTLTWVYLQTIGTDAFAKVRSNMAAIVEKEGSITSRPSSHRNEKSSQEFKVAGYFKLFDEHDNVDNDMVQRLAAFLMAIREINNKTDGIADDLLPDTELLVTLESPDYSLYGVEVSVAESLFIDFEYTGEIINLYQLCFININ